MLKLKENWKISNIFGTMLGFALMLGIVSLGLTFAIWSIKILISII